MTSTENSGLGHGSNGAPQGNLEEQLYPTQAAAITADGKPPKYAPSPKHVPGHGWGSDNPIRTIEEGQRLLDTGYHYGRQIYNITQDGIIVKFQPDNTPENGYHPYAVAKPRDIPAPVRKKMMQDGKLTHAQYTRLGKGKKK